MAKAQKKANPKPKANAAKAKPKKARRLTRGGLVATARGVSFTIDVKVDFISGLGQVTAVLFRSGVLINMQSISLGTTVNFSDVESGDTMAVNGECAGRTTITISAPTSPSTPESFEAGIIMANYLFL